MLVHRFAWRALIRIIPACQATNFPALLIVDVVNIQRILLCNRIGNPEQLGGTVISLHRLTFGARFIEFAAYVHAFVCEQIQAIELFVGCASGMAQVSHQSAAPGLLNDNSTGFRICVTGREHLWIDHRVEQRVAVNPGTMFVSQLGCLDGQKPFKEPGMDGRPGKCDSQPQNQGEVGFHDGLGVIKPCRRDDAAANFSKRAPAKE